MSQTIFIQLTTAGPGVGPFDIYAVDAFNVVTGPFETNIPTAQLVSGFVSVNAPNNIVKVRLVSKSATCPNILILPLPATTTTTAGPTTTTTTKATTSTTSTSSTTTSTTSTTTAAPTTTTSTSSTSTTSTTTAFPGFCYSMFNNLPIGQPPIVVPYVNALGVSTSVSVGSQITAYVCGLSYTPTPNMTILSSNTCATGCPGTTSTTSTSTSTTSTSTTTTSSTTTTTTAAPTTTTTSSTTTTTTASPIAGKLMCYDPLSCAGACTLCQGCGGIVPAE